MKTRSQLLNTFAPNNERLISAINCQDLISAVCFLSDFGLSSIPASTISFSGGGGFNGPLSGISIMSGTTAVASIDTAGAISLDNGAIMSDGNGTLTLAGLHVSGADFGVDSVGNILVNSLTIATGLRQYGINANGNFAASSITLTGAAPNTSTSTGTKGQIAVDASYLYVCTATNSWKRISLGSW